MATIKAKVKPKLLEWARESIGLTVADAAKKLHVKEERLLAWELGQDQPSIGTLRKMTTVYKRPIAVFYLQQPPEGFAVMKDFRRLPGKIAGSYSSAMLLEIRNAHERRQLALDLLTEIGEKPKQFTLVIDLNNGAEKAGNTIRNALGLTYEQQSAWRDNRTAFNAWRAAIEAYGTLIFQATRVSVDEMRGFSVAETELPVVVVNRKDFPSARTFSLLHEFVHLTLRRSGLCDMSDSDHRLPEEQAIEIFCNWAAAAALMPPEQFLVEDIVVQRGPKATNWKDDDIVELATRYSVSREALVRRLLTLGRTTDTFYRLKRDQYSRDIQARKALRKEEAKGKKFRRNPSREAIGTLGRPFITAVLENYYQARITLRDVSEHLGVRTRHITKIQQLMMGNFSGGGAAI